MTIMWVVQTLRYNCVWDLKAMHTLVLGACWPTRQICGGHINLSWISNNKKNLIEEQHERWKKIHFLVAKIVMFKVTKIPWRPWNRVPTGLDQWITIFLWVGNFFYGRLNFCFWKGWIITVCCALRDPIYFYRTGVWGSCSEGNCLWCNGSQRQSCELFSVFI